MKRVVLATDTLSRADFYVEWLDKLHFDLALAKRFAGRNPNIETKVRLFERAIELLHDTWRFEQLLPNWEFYKEEVESAHRMRRVDSAFADSLDRQRDPHPPSDTGRE